MMGYKQRGGFQGKPHMVIDFKLETLEKGNLISAVRHATLRFVFTLGSGGFWSGVDRGLKNRSHVLKEPNAGNERTAVPFGESVFTKMIEEALGGNSTTVFMGHVRTDPQSLDDSVQTLGLTTIAKVRHFEEKTFLFFSPRYEQMVVLQSKGDQLGNLCHAFEKFDTVTNIF